MSKLKFHIDLKIVIELKIDFDLRDRQIFGTCRVYRVAGDLVNRNRVQYRPRALVLTAMTVRAA